MTSKLSKEELTDIRDYMEIHRNKEEWKKELDTITAENVELMHQIVGRKVSPELDGVKVKIYENSARMVELRKLLK